MEDPDLDRSAKAQAVAVSTAAAGSDRLVATGPAEGIDRTLRWMLAHRLFGSPDDTREYQKRALEAATFGYLCGPRRADDRGRFRTARFAAIFFHLDDRTGQEFLSDQRWRGFHTSLIALLQGRDGGSEHAALAEWLAELRSEGMKAPTALADFEQSFLDYCLSLDDERQADPAAMSEQAFFDLRRRTIFVEPVLNQWRVSMGLEVTLDAPFRTELLAAQGMARDLVVLANDLGSLLRDRTSETTEKSMVLQYARRLGSVDAAAARCVAEYNARVAELQAAIAAADRAGIEWFPALVDLLAGLVDGNLDSMAVLVQRYSGSESWLRHLHRVRS